MEKNRPFSGKFQKIAMRENRGILGLFSFAILIKNKTFRLYANMQICKYVNMQICKYANMQICECW